MTAYAENMEPARSLLHEMISDPLCHAADIIDNHTTSYPGEQIFYDHPGAGDDRIVEFFVLPPLLVAWGLFGGLLQHPRGGLIPMKAFSSAAWRGGGRPLLRRPPFLCFVRGPGWG